MTGSGISILVPFRADDAGRAATWDWLSRYWVWALPDAELIMGTDDGAVFSKTSAVNRAASLASGDVFVVMDADCYMDAEALTSAAAAIRSSEDRSWWMPYNGFWRIRRAPSERLLESRPEQGVQFHLPPAPGLVQGGESAWDHAYTPRRKGALCSVVPAAAFRHVGGMDPRFRGWGGEDTAFSLALDTLWAPRSYNDAHHAAHLWHARIGEGTGSVGRVWRGQAKPGAGRRLREEYQRRSGDARAMRSLVEEGLGR